MRKYSSRQRREPIGRGDSAPDCAVEGNAPEGSVIFMSLTLPSFKAKPKLARAQVGPVRAMLRQQKIDESPDAVNASVCSTGVSSFFAIALTRKKQHGVRCGGPTGRGWVEAGAEPKSVPGQIRHSHIPTTMYIYAKTRPRVTAAYGREDDGNSGLPAGTNGTVAEYSHQLNWNVLERKREEFPS